MGCKTKIILYTSPNFRNLDHIKESREKLKKGGKALPKNEEISREKAHTNTWRYILTITYFFLNQMRVNVCEHMVKMAPHESF